MTRSGDIELYSAQAREGNPVGHAENLDAHQLVVGVVIEDHPRAHLFGLDDGRVVKPEVESVGFFVETYLHCLFLWVRSKYAVTIRHGTVVSL